MNLILKDNATDFNHFFNDFFPGRRMVSENGKTAFAPQVDIEAEDEYYLIKADLPGVKKEAIALTLEDGVLTLDAERSDSCEEEANGKVIRKERRYGKYSRSFQVGRRITVDDVSGQLVDGVLTITVPKESQHAPASKRIEIN